ncbi:MAG TPA: hypothetical protein VIM42_06295 [Clostridium sp.]
MRISALATSVGVVIAAKLNVNQQNVVGDFLTGVAQSVLIIAAQAQNIQSRAGNQGGDNGNNNSSGNDKELQKQIDELKTSIKRFQDDMNS